MLYYDRIDVSEGIDVNKTNESKECDICHYWYFFWKSVNLNQMSTIYWLCLYYWYYYFKHSQSWFDYHCIISRIRKNETIKGIQNIDLIKKSI